MQKIPIGPNRYTDPQVNLISRVFSREYVCEDAPTYCTSEKHDYSNNNYHLAEYQISIDYTTQIWDQTGLSRMSRNLFLCKFHTNLWLNYFQINYICI